MRSENETHHRKQINNNIPKFTTQRELSFSILYRYVLILELILEKETKKGRDYISLITISFALSGKLNHLIDGVCA